MKVGFLVGSVSREAGGLFRSVCGFAKAVMSTNATASVFGLRDQKSAADLPKWHPVSVRTFQPQFRAWGYSSQLAPALLASDLDILSIHGLWKYCSVASRRWHRRTGRPYVVHPHGMLESWALRNAKWRKLVAAFLYEDQHLRGAACLHALCEAEARSIRAYGMRNPICVIPNGVDLPYLEPKNTNPSLLSTDQGPLAVKIRQLIDGRRMLLYLGRLHPKKNLVALLQAWAILQKSEEWRLVIAGWNEGTYENELERLARKLRLSFLPLLRRGVVSKWQASGSSVVFIGPQFGAEKDACYSACDAFVLPSLSEGLPMTVLEAWAHAKPVVMSSECNLVEGFAAGAALRIGTTASQIAAGLKELTDMTDDERKAMGARGRSLVMEKFSWPRIGEQMRAVYEWVLGGGKPPETVRFL
jgi:poly(glycerol-phosphate) alpha-glucosyltransferase